MESALAWIGQLAEWIGRFFPRRIILDLTTGAIKYVGGDKAVVCGPGIHWYWPWRSTFAVYPTAHQVEDLRTQTITTADDVDIAIVVGGMLVYEVVDIAKLLPRTYHAPQALRNMAIAAIHDICCRMKWKELKDEQRRGTLDTKLKNAARKTLDNYGIRVIELQLTDLARTKVYKVMQSTSKDENE